MQGDSIRLPKMNKAQIAFASATLMFLLPLAASSQREVARSPNWKPVPGTDLPSLMEPNPQPWRIVTNTISRNGDDINFEVDADGEYVKYSANCRTRMMTRLFTGYLNENGQILGVRPVRESFFSANDSPQRTRVLEYACSQKSSVAQNPGTSQQNSPSVFPPELFQVPRGQLTFDAEGQECPDKARKCNKYHSRKPHVPDNISGVTIGRGYDLKRRTPEKIKRDLMATGLTPEDAEVYAKAGCKMISTGSCEPQFTGDKARKFISDNQDKLREITPEQQRKLFEITYSEMEEDIKRISNNEKDKYGAVDFETLNPKIKDVLVDLRFRGDYTPDSRKLIQKPVANNDFQAFKEAMGNEYWVNKSTPVPSDRFKRRLIYLNN